MNENPYLIALALIEQKGLRALPLGGKSLKESIDISKGPGEIGSKLIEQLMLRVFQKSEDGALRRANGDKSLLIIQIPMILMTDKIPLIKSEWIKSGDSSKLLLKIKEVSKGVWSTNFSKEKGVLFSRLD